LFDKVDASEEVPTLISESLAFLWICPEKPQFPKIALPTGSVWLMTDIAEAKGRQRLYTKQAPQLLKALREMALIQSVESSNRIEGVTVAPERLVPLVVGKAKPRDRSEEKFEVIDEH
jgi:hypothetical protein